jgi:hypothetical protein
MCGTECDYREAEQEITLKVLGCMESPTTVNADAIGAKGITAVLQQDP